MLYLYGICLVLTYLINLLPFILSLCGVQYIEDPEKFDKNVSENAKVIDKVYYGLFWLGVDSYGSSNIIWQQSYGYICGMIWLIFAKFWMDC